MAVCLKSEIQEIDLTKASDHISTVSKPAVLVVELLKFFF
jgi:hypothetical protein